jgi:hypothetical protein
MVVGTDQNRNHGETRLGQDQRIVMFLGRQQTGVYQVSGKALCDSDIQRREADREYLPLQQLRESRTGECCVGIGFGFRCVQQFMRYSWRQPEAVTALLKFFPKGVSVILFAREVY